MTNISNNFLKKNNMSEKNKVNELNYFPALNQGKKFKKYQNKINVSLEKKAEYLSGKEGFDLLQPNNELTTKINKIIEQNDYSNDQQTVENLRNEYKITLNTYENLLKEINGTTNSFFNRINPNNPYFNKCISFPNGAKYYVTKQGVAKYIQNRDIWNSVNIPTDYININIPWSEDYKITGTTIPTTPPLLVGTPLKYGQSVGNEGSNVFVDQLLPSDITPSYVGCYSSSPNNDNMTFIGNKPSSLDVYIQNGNFEQPAIKTNSYLSLNDHDTVIGWGYTAVLLNNSKEWGYPIPYPKGNQCTSLQKTNNIRQNIALYTNYTYTLTFYSCGRDCCSSPNSSNPINIDLYDQNMKLILSIYKYTPPLNKWTYYSVNFTVPSSQTYRIYFSGTTSSSDKSSAIQGISLSANNNTSGEYNYDDCKTAAINSGYQYFALQSVNNNTSKGYCAVSNSSPSISQYGESLIPSKIITLWSSNTKNQPGNIATLNNIGSLTVTNSSGKNMYSSPASNAKPSNYYGCYSDNSNRSMSLYNNGKQLYNLQQCQDIANSNGYTYFGLQNSTSGNNAQCVLSNDFNASTKYGKASNCSKIADGSYSGGGWSNAVYNAKSPESNYYLILQDDGNMCIYRGTGPNDKQGGSIWCTMTNGKQQTPNPTMVASNNKYGKNWMSSGSALAPGDFLSSTKGDLVLMMENDGNLVLYTYNMEKNCQKMKDGNIGGGIKTNAAYDIGKKAITQNMGLLGFVDEDSNLHTYPIDNQSKDNTYNLIKGMDTPGNDIPGTAFSNATLESCKKACNSITDCYGFVFNIDEKYNKGCWPKTKSMYPFGGKGNLNSSLDIYIRNRIPKTPPLGVSLQTDNIDSIKYDKYLKNGDIENKYGLSKITSIQKQQLEQMEVKMNMLSQQINNYTDKYGNGSMQAQQQSNNNISGINNYLEDLNKTNKEIINNVGENNNAIQNILNDSDIVVLKKNYDYLFWSILAAGTVLISMNVVNKQ